MESDTDTVHENLIENFRPRLKQHIDVEPVLDRIHFLGTEDKERIRQKRASEGNSAAVNLLLSAVTKKPHSPGWFQAFVDALVSAGCSNAADYMQVNLPEPEVEAENDYCIRLIELLSPSLLDMKTDQVCPHCVSEKLLTFEDAETITTKTTTSGNREGARELLRRIVRGRPGWFSTFLDVLRKTEHKKLYMLTGGSPDCDVPDEKPSSKTHKGPGGEAGVLATEEKTEENKTDTPECLEICSSTETKEDKEIDLYRAESTDPRELPDILESPQPAAAGPENADIVLRDYQMDVARPALEGENIIVCLPTGSGKTRIAVYVTKKHLESRRVEGKAGKVVVLVNKVPLAEQLHSSEFQLYLKPTYKVSKVSGDSQLKISFTEIVKNNDVVICTAQILQNYLERSNTDEDEGVHLRDITLMVIDECHHTQKGDVYNHIMMRYLMQKHKNLRLQKELKQPVPLPQILGLTASPGVGAATKMAKAVEHILRICANLDASKIMTGDIGKHKKEQTKTILTVEDRKKDPFGDVIKTMMNSIHAYTELNPTSELGSQNYEQWVVQREQQAAKDEDQRVRVCADHLRRYNEGLKLSNTIRMCDALSFLEEFYEEELKKKTAPDEEHFIQITDAERFLFNLFQDNKDELQALAKNPEFENDSLSKLRMNILKEFSGRDKARGIIFTKTRRSAIALSQWIQENSKFEDIGVKASHIIGAGDQSVVKPMTSAEQKDVLDKFRRGDVNLLIATSVAEEGLDIAKCNFVTRYGLETNEIAMIQAQGRGRAEDSSYTVVEVKGTAVVEKEHVNEYRKNMMDKAIVKIGELSQAEYNKKISEFQIQAILEEKLRMKAQKQNNQKRASPSEVKLSCRGCSKHVCSCEDIQIIADMHRVNVSAQFRKMFIRTENTSLQQRLLDGEKICYIACKECGKRWGSMMFYRGIECPSLDVSNFVLTVGEKKLSKCSKWRDVPVELPAFDYAEHAGRLVESSDEEETD